MPDLAPGSMFAGHRIEAVAGRGGMGVVYRATHLALDHVVAVKVISPELAADDVFRKRFVDEQRAAVSIRHPNVVPIHNAGEDEGLLFVTMDLVEGADLRRVLSERGALTAEHAVDLLSQVGAALDAAHERGLVHRDVKPGNILIESRPTGEHVYLTDFGLTKRIGSASGVTATDAFVGTLDYVAPEQIRGERLDARADVYAMGCVLYEMLAGAAPFDDRDEKVAKIYAHLQDAPPSLTEAKPGLPLALDAVVRRAMEKEARLRFQSARDTARAATAAAEGRAIPDDTRSVATGLAAPAAATALTPAPPGVPSAATPAPGDTLASAPGDTLASAPGDTLASAGDTLASAPTAGETTVDPTHETDAPEPERPTDQAAQRSSGAPGGRPSGRAPADVRVRRTLPTKLLGVIGAAVAAAVVIGLLLAGSGNGGGGEGGGGQPGEGAAAAAAVFGDPIEIPDMPVGIAAAEGAVWVAGRLGTTVTPIGQQSGRLDESVTVGEAPEGVATGDGSVWVALGGENEVARIDPSSGVVERISVGEFPREVTIGAGRAWVTNGRENTVTPIDLDTGTPGSAITVGSSPHGIAVGAEAVWVTNREDNTVTRIDPRSALADGEAIPVGENPKGIAVAAGTVWVANTDEDSISMIDPAAGNELGRISVGEMPRGVTAAFDSIWVASADGTVTQINPRSQSVVTTIDLTEADPEASPEEIAADQDRLWVTTGEGGSVIRIAP